jgi:brefeldin A-inhibited guanine nucleotide-exchange protein
MAEEYTPEPYLPDEASVTTEAVQAPLSPVKPEEPTTPSAPETVDGDDDIVEESRNGDASVAHEAIAHANRDEEAPAPTTTEPEERFDASTPDQEAPTTDQEVPTADPEVSITDQQVPITDQEVPITDPEVSITDQEVPTISLSQNDAPVSVAESMPEEQTARSRTSSVHSYQDRQLPPIPTNQSPASPPAPKAIADGIPLPIGADAPEPPKQSPEPPKQSPEPPVTPTRTSSRNAPTSAKNQAHGRVTSKSLATNNAAGQVTISSMVFVIQALETIGASKEAKKRKQLSDSVQKAVDAIRETAPEPPTDPNVVFEPLRLACLSNNSQLATTALDCIGKLISYSYLSITPSHINEGHDHEQPSPLIERAIETICDCFKGDSTPDAVQLQIVKALLAAVLNDKVVVHGAGLLKAIRQTYNIFLLSRSSANQQTAQGTLTQMVHTVFERVKFRLAVKEAQASNNRSSLSVQIPHGDNDSASGKEEPIAIPPTSDNGPQEKITLQSFENRKSFDDERITDAAPTTVNRAPRKLTGAHSDAASDSSESSQEDEDEVYVKDAFLVFRAMCKLSIKSLPAEQIADLKSHGMRSKLLSLHLIHVILLHHINVFVSPLSTIRSSSGDEPTGFIHAVKQYLCLSLSRNAASAVGHVFEVCCEIFWLILSNMRVMLKV